MTIHILNAVVSTVAVVGLIASALGWRHSLRRPFYSPEWYFAMAKVLMAVGIASRLILWDVVWGIMLSYDREFAYEFSDLMGHTNINILPGLVILVGVYCSLKARQLILYHDRGIDWHWTIAWAYPSARTIIKLVRRNRDV